MKVDNIFGSAMPYLACFVILERDGKIPFVLRENTGYMNGYYSLPAGKTEWRESSTAGAAREAKEEVAVDLQPEQLTHAITIHRHGEDIDWIDIYFTANDWQGEPTNAEPDVHSELVWFKADNLPDTIVPAQLYALQQYQAGKNYAEYGWN